MTYDVIVVGLGAMGSAAIYQLAKRGARVLGLDQFHSPHNLGSSHGGSRITRQACHEGPEYTPLALRSNEIWKELETITKRELFVRCGYLLLSPTGQSGAPHGVVDPIPKVAAIARDYQIQHEILETTDIQNRFPMFRGLTNELGYFEPGGGALLPEACIDVNLSAAESYGAELRFNTKVQGWNTESAGVSITTSEGVTRGTQLVVTTGPWITDSLPADYREIFKIRRQVLHWYEIESQFASVYSPRKMPTYIWDAGEQPNFYGFPALFGFEGGFKVSSEQYATEESNPDSVDRIVSENEVEEIYKWCIQPHFSGVTPRNLRSEVCMYTDTPDYGFIIDRHPDHEEILIVSPCSGHGFKHSAAVGESVAELILNGSSPLIGSSFLLSRFRQ